jgi:hypothetical protein
MVAPYQSLPLLFIKNLLVYYFEVVGSVRCNFCLARAIKDLNLTIVVQAYPETIKNLSQLGVLKD